MKFAQMLCVLTLTVIAVTAPRPSDASADIDPNGWYRVDRDIRTQYTDVGAYGRPSSVVYVQVNKGEMVSGDTMKRLVRAGVASPESFIKTGTLVNGRVEPIRKTTVPDSTNSYASEKIDPNARYLIERDIRGSYVEYGANGRRADVVHVQANRGDVISGARVQRLISAGVAGKFSFTKLRVGAAGLVAAGLLAQTEDSIASTVRVSGDAPQAVRLNSTNAGSAASDLESEAVSTPIAQPSRANLTAK